MVVLSLFRVREGGGGPPIYKSEVDIIDDTFAETII